MVIQEIKYLYLAEDIQQFSADIYFLHISGQMFG